MKEYFKQSALIIMCFIGVCLIAIYIFTLPAVLSSFDLSASTKSNLATTINGITAPILGIFTSVLLFLTLKKQIDTAKAQDQKNDFDLLFLLIDKFEKGIDAFYFETTTHAKHADGSPNDIKNRSEGVEALEKQIGFLMNNTVSHVNTKITFKCLPVFEQIIYLTRLYKVITSRINEVVITNQNKTFLRTQLNLLYKVKLEDSFERVIKLLEKFPSLKDDYSIELENFLLEDIRIT